MVGAHPEGKQQEQRCGGRTELAVWWNSEEEEPGSEERKWTQELRKISFNT